MFTERLIELRLDDFLVSAGIAVAIAAPFLIRFAQNRLARLRAVAQEG